MFSQSVPSDRRARRLRPRAFTLIEAALVTCIIGVGVLAMLQLLAAGTLSNASGAELTTGINLAKNVREMMFGLRFADPTTPTHWGAETGENLASYDDLDDFDGLAFSPPIDARRRTLDDYANWQQSITVQTLDLDRLTTVVPDGSMPSARATVTITHNGKYICNLSWLAFDTATD